jgi:hypothetical protein
VRRSGTGAAHVSRRQAGGLSHMCIEARKIATVEPSSYREFPERRGEPEKSAECLNLRYLPTDGDGGHPGYRQGF